MRGKSAKFVLLLLVLALVASACGGSKSKSSTPTSSASAPKDTSPIKVGGLLDKTGVAAPNGLAALDGVNLAIETVNAAGGINGRQIEFDEQDPAFNVGQATALLQRFTADSKVVALIGPNSDSVSTPLTDPVNKAQIVSLVTSGAGGRPNADFGKWMFSIPVRNDFIVNKVAAALKDLGLTKIAIVYSTSRPFAASARDYMTAAATKNGLTIVGEPYGFADADVNFSALITKIKSGTQPQAIFCSCLATAAGPMILQAKNAGLSARWVSDASLLDPNFYKLSQNSADGTLVATPFDTSRSDQVVKTFLADFKKKYNKEPNVYAAYGYDTALLFINALKSIKGDVTRESVRAAIAGASFDGATGRISFPDGQGVAARADVFVVQMKEGAYVPVTK